MKFTYISHKKTMSITLFIYRRCLEIFHKGALSRIAAFLGMSISKSASKPSMVGDTNSYVKSNWADVLEKLCVKELELTREVHQGRPRYPCGKSVALKP